MRRLLVRRASKSGPIPSASRLASISEDQRFFHCMVPAEGIQILHPASFLFSQHSDQIIRQSYRSETSFSRFVNGLQWFKQRILLVPRCAFKQFSAVVIGYFASALAPVLPNHDGVEMGRTDFDHVETCREEFF